MFHDSRGLAETLLGEGQEKVDTWVIGPSSSTPPTRKYGGMQAQAENWDDFEDRDEAAGGDRSELRERE